MLFVIDVLLVLMHSELNTSKGVLNILLDYIALIAVLGYAYDKKTASKSVWLMFAVIFVAWKISGYVYLDSNPMRIDAMMIIMYAPLYWSIILYSLLTMEEDEAKRTRVALIRDKFVKRFKGFYTIFSGLSLVTLILCLIVMV